MYGFEKKILTYKAGNIKIFLDEWQNITTDPFVLNVLENGLRISLEDNPSCHNITPQIYMSESEKKIIDTEIQKLLRKQVIKVSSYSEGNFVSSIFTRTKPDGSVRIILNLQ